MNFPVYPIPNSFYLDTEDDGAIYAYSSSTGKKYVVDPKFIEGNNLGARRLIYGIQHVPLMPLNAGFTSLEDFLLGATRGAYIDNLGNIQYWQGKRFIKIRSYKIRNCVLNEEEGIYLISLIGVNKLIATKYPPPLGYKYASLLELDDGPILAGDASSNVKSRKKI